MSTRQLITPQKGVQSMSQLVVGSQCVNTKIINKSYKNKTKATKTKTMQPTNLFTNYCTSLIHQQTAVKKL